MSKRPPLNPDDADGHLMMLARLAARRRFGYPSADASQDYEDYGQDAVVAVLERRRRRPDDARTLHVEVNRRVLDAARRHRGRERHYGPDARMQAIESRVHLQSEAELGTRNEPTPLDQAATRELIDRVLTAVSPRQERLFRLRMTGLSQAEIARALGRTEAGVNCSLRDARRRARRHLPDLTDPG
ncbi:MAG: sigma factor-like helix-turn-helix DNA-binding protein [Planctomycetota bacterium]